MKGDKNLLDRMEDDAEEDEWGGNEDDEDEDEDESPKLQDMTTQQFNHSMSSYFGSVDYYDPRSEQPDWKKIEKMCANTRLKGARVDQVAIRGSFQKWKGKNEELYDQVIADLRTAGPPVPPRPNYQGQPYGQNPPYGQYAPQPYVFNSGKMTPAEEAAALERDMWSWAKENLPPARVQEMLEDRLGGKSGKKQEDGYESKLMGLVFGLLEDKVKNKESLDEIEDKMLDRMEKYKGLFGGGNPYHDDPGVAMGQVISKSLHENTSEILDTVRETGGLPRKKHRATMKELDTHAQQVKQELESMGQYYGQCPNPNCGAVVLRAASQCHKCGTTIDPDENAPIPPYIIHRPKVDRQFIPGGQGGLGGAPSPEKPPLPPPAANPPSSTVPPQVSPPPEQADLIECESCGAMIPEDATECPKCGAIYESDSEVYLDRALNEQNGLLSVRLRNKISWGHLPNKSAEGLWYITSEEEQKGMLYSAQKGLDYIYGLLGPIAQNRPEILQDYGCPDLLTFYQEDKSRTWLTSFFDTIKTLAADPEAGPYGTVELTPKEVKAYEDEVQAVIDDLLGLEDDSIIPAPSGDVPEKAPEPDNSDVPKEEPPTDVPKTDEEPTPTKTDDPEPEKPPEPEEKKVVLPKTSAGGPPGVEPLRPPDNHPADFIFCVGCGNSYQTGESWEAHSQMCKKLNQLQQDGKIDPYTDMAGLSSQFKVVEK